MADQQADKSQRTEQPTPRRLKKAREQGRVPRSTEVAGALGMAALLLYGRVFGEAWVDRFEALMAGTITSLAAPELGTDEAVAVIGSVQQAALFLLAAPLGLMLAAGLGGNLVQSTPVLTFKPMKPDLSRLNPVKGIKKVVALSKWVDLIKALIKMGLYGAVAYSAIRDALVDGVVGSGNAEGAFAAIAALSADVIFRVTLVALALALLDYLFRRYDHVRGLRMTKKEVRDERKESEGDPLVRARLRSKQMALARSRMMTKVKDATVVVTNPTHYAIALRYVPGETDVPEVLAKGRERIAQRIRDLAVEHGIPIVQDPPLARALFRAVEVGSHVPANLYRAVAEVLALVMRGSRTRSAAEGESR